MGIYTIVQCYIYGILLCHVLYNRVGGMKFNVSEAVCKPYSIILMTNISSSLLQIRPIDANEAVLRLSGSTTMKDYYQYEYKGGESFHGGMVLLNC